MNNSPIRNNHMIHLINKIRRSNTNCIFKRFEAFDNTKINQHIIDILKKNKYLSDDIPIYSIMKHKVKLSIYMTHLLLWSTILTEYKNISLNTRIHIPHYIVLEDDINIDQNIELKLKSLQKYIPSDYDILFLGYGGRLLGKQINEYITQPSPGQHQDTNHGLFAYIINPNSIDKLTNILLPIDSLYIKGNWQSTGSTIPHMDWKIRYFYNKEIKAYYLHHPFITHMNKYDKV